MCLIVHQALILQSTAMAVLVLLATTTRAWIVAPNLGTLIANGCHWTTSCLAGSHSRLTLSSGSSGHCIIATSLAVALALAALLLSTTNLGAFFLHWNLSAHER